MTTLPSSSSVPDVQDALLAPPLSRDSSLSSHNSSVSSTISMVPSVSSTTSSVPSPRMPPLSSFPQSSVLFKPARPSDLPSVRLTNMTKQELLRLLQLQRGLLSNVKLLENLDDKGEKIRILVASIQKQLGHIKIQEEQEQKELEEAFSAIKVEEKEEKGIEIIINPTNDPVAVALSSSPSSSIHKPIQYFSKYQPLQRITQQEADGILSRTMKAAGLNYNNEGDGVGGHPPRLPQRIGEQPGATKKRSEGDHNDDIDYWEEEKWNDPDKDEQTNIKREPSPGNGSETFDDEEDRNSLGVLSTAGEDEDEDGGEGYDQEEDGGDDEGEDDGEFDGDSSKGDMESVQSADNNNNSKQGKSSGNNGGDRQSAGKQNTSNHNPSISDT